MLEERLRLARDLHAGASRLLTGVALETDGLLRMPGNKLAGAQDAPRAGLDESYPIIHEALVVVAHESRIPMKPEPA